MYTYLHLSACPDSSDMFRDSIGVMVWTDVIIAHPEWMSALDSEVQLQLFESLTKGIPALRVWFLLRQGVFSSSLELCAHH